MFRKFQTFAVSSLVNKTILSQVTSCSQFCYYVLIWNTTKYDRYNYQPSRPYNKGQNALAYVLALYEKESSTLYIYI